MSFVQEDYTPKDFMAKLMTKPQINIQTQQYSQSISHNSNIAQSLISPKISTIKKYHFQVIKSKQNHKILNQTSCSPKKYFQIASTKSQNNLKSINGDQNFHINHKTTVFNQIIQENPESVYLNPQKIINQNKECKSLSEQKLKFSRAKSNRKQNSPLRSHSNCEQDLILKKTQLFLKAALKGKIQGSQISNISNQLEKVFETPYEFDKIMQSFNLNSSKLAKQQNKNVKRCKQKHSKSINLSHKQKINGLKRIKSEFKYVPQVKSKKQMKFINKQIKQQIIKHIKKMKHLVLMNEKSLRLSKKISFK